MYLFYWIFDCVLARNVYPNALINEIYEEENSKRWQTCTNKWLWQDLPNSLKARIILCVVKKKIVGFYRVESLGEAKSRQK